MSAQTVHPYHSPPSESERAFGVVWRHAVLAMTAGAFAFMALAVLFVLVAPPLADLDLGGILVFVLASAGFGIIPGMILGIVMGEHALDD